MKPSDSHPSSQGRREQLCRLESLCDQFELLCKRGAPVDLGAFLAGNGGNLSREIVVELIQIDLEYRLGSGGLPDVEQYASDLHPYESLARAACLSFASGAPEPISCVAFGDAVYEIHEEIGSGGMARIFRGFDKRLDRFVAIKKLRTDLGSMKTAIDRFQNEARVVAAIRHDGIIRVFDVGIQDDELFIVFELLDGGTLADRISGGSMPPREAAEHVRYIAETMHAAHVVGVIHLDLKPSNVLLTLSGELKVSDFGLATFRKQSVAVSESGGLSGTFNYMAPEQARGQISLFDERTDVYGIGAILYELLTGRPPFQGSLTPDTFDQLLNHAPVSIRDLNSRVPMDLDRICMKCLSRTRKDRYQSSMALASDLQNFLNGKPVSANSIGPVGRSLKWCVRNQAVSAVTAIGLFAMVFISVLSVNRILVERNRFRDQRDAAIENLYDSLVGEARAIRLAGSNGYRVSAWDKIDRAIRLNAPNMNRALLRNEIVASMGDFAGQKPMIWKSAGASELFVASAIHPNDRLIALGLLDGSVSVRNLSDGEEHVRLRGHQSGVFEIVFSSDGNRMASADDTGLINIWKNDGQSGWSRETRFPGSQSARPRYVKAVSLAFANDDRFLFSCPFGGSTITRWRLGIQNDKKPVMADEFVSESAIVRFSRSNHTNRLAIGTADNEVLMWDLVTRAIVGRLPIESNIQLLDVVFSPDDRRIAVGTRNGVHVFDVVRETRTMALPGDHLITLSFSPDGQTLALPSEDQNLVRLWNVNTNQQSAVLDNDAYEALYSSDGSWLVCVAATELTIWDLRDQSIAHQLHGHDQGVVRTGFFDNDQLIFSGDSDGTLTIHPARTNKATASVETDLQFLSIIRKFGLAVFQRDGQFQFHQFPVTPGATPLFAMEHGLGPRIWDGWFNSTGELFLAAGSDGVKVWSAEWSEDDEGRPSLSLEFREKLFNEYAGSLAISDDLNRIGWVDFVGGVHVRDLDNNLNLSVPGLSATVPSGLAFIPGTHRLIAADVKGTVRIRDVDHPDSETRILSDESFPVEANANWKKVHIALHPMGRMLCLQRGKQISIWDLGLSCQLITLPPTDELPWSIAWSSSADQIALGYANGIVAVWDLHAINEQLRPFGLSWENE